MAEREQLTEADFDRWLAEVRREAAEKAWIEGALAAGGHYEVLLRCPYR